MISVKVYKQKKISVNIQVEFLNKAIINTRKNNLTSQETPFINIFQQKYLKIVTSEEYEQNYGSEGKWQQSDDSLYKPFRIIWYILLW